jgi:hypothetical protein
MYNEHNQQLMMVIFDGIDNSVFKSQVLAPLLQQISVQKNLEITLVSFERKSYSNEQLIKIIPPHDQLHVILCPRTPFIGIVGLWIAGYYFKKIIASIPLEKIIARGPLAGFIVLQFIKNLYEEHEPQEVIDVIVQARGLAAEEYRLACEQESNQWYHRLFQKWYFQALQQIEYEVYRNDIFKKKYGSFEIEAVSDALKQYLIEQYEAPDDKIFIAEKDLVTRINQDDKTIWRTKIRSLLNIPQEALVYCYSGSAKPWQCITETIDFMQEKMSTNTNIWLMLLIPEQDIPIVKQILEKSNLNKNQIIMTSVPAARLLEYLSAADYGLLLRKKDIVNWVSRPTKALEYYSVGPEIIHNDTIAYVKKLTTK